MEIQVVDNGQSVLALGFVSTIVVVYESVDGLNFTLKLNSSDVNTASIYAMQKMNGKIYLLFALGLGFIDEVNNL